MTGLAIATFSLRVPPRIHAVVQNSHNLKNGRCDLIVDRMLIDEEAAITVAHAIPLHPRFRVVHKLPDAVADRL